MSSRFGTKWGRIATATLLAALLLVPQAAYARPRERRRSGLGDGVVGGPVSDDGVTILVPYILRSRDHSRCRRAYQLALIQSVPTLDRLLHPRHPNVADFCFPVPDVSNVLPWLEDTVANASSAASTPSTGRRVQGPRSGCERSSSELLNLPIDLFDGFTTARGAPPRRRRLAPRALVGCPLPVSGGSSCRPVRAGLR